MIRAVTIAAMMIVSANAVFAADMFYIGKDANTNKCTVVKVKPDGNKLIMVGTESYATKEDAKAARKTAAECKKRT